MKITLKKLAHSTRLSHETACYSADVYIDGKKAGTAENSGTGGADLIQPHSLQKLLEDSAVFVIEHGSGIRPVELCAARLRASLRAPRVERVIDLNGKKRTIRVVATKTESVTRKVR